MLAAGQGRLRRSAPTVAEHVVGALWSGSVVVPADFLGMCIHSYPDSRAGTVSAAPTYEYHTWRCHDYAPLYNFGVNWRALHVGASDFEGASTGTNVVAGGAGTKLSQYASDHWAALDAAVDLHYSAGRTISYQIYGCPEWAAATPLQADPYGGLGGSSAPSSQTYLSSFVDRLVKRYNTDTIRNNGGAKKLKYLEVWNEPTYVVSSSSFFTGSAADMAAMARTVKTAAKAVDSSIIVLSPSFTGTPGSYITPFLNASDGAGGYGRDHVEGIGYHPYTTQLQRYPGMGGLGVAARVDADVRAAIVAGGLASDFPVYGMEQGIHPTAGNVLLTTWSTEMKARYVAQITALYAAMGWGKVTWYSHDNTLSGDPSNNSQVSSALAWSAQLAGKTITAVDVLSTGEMRVTHTGGTMSF